MRTLSVAYMNLQNIEASFTLRTLPLFLTVRNFVTGLSYLLKSQYLVNMQDTSRTIDPQNQFLPHLKIRSLASHQNPRNLLTTER